jgi:glucose/arabinose dehydrogenase
MTPFMNRCRALVLALGVIAVGSEARAQASLPAGFRDQPIVGGLRYPTGFAFLPDGRCLFVEQLSGRVRLIVNGVIASTDPVCTIPDVRNDDWARGVYGIAVDPRWPSPPYVYVHFNSNASPRRVKITRFTAAGDLAFTGNGALTIDPATRYELFSDLYDAAHNGGTLRFGPDQMLYASVGDSFTTPCAAQHLASLRGVVLRLEVRNLPPGSGGPPAKTLLAPPDNPYASDPNLNARLVWARGFRNPFRFHIDPTDGALFVADVGEAAWEEIDRVSAGGGNFGWPLFEGPAPYRSCAGASGSGLTPPIFAYGNGGDQQCVIGAGPYRRPATGAYRFPPEYEGDYFFSDLYTGALRRLKGGGTSWSIPSPVQGQSDSVAWGTGLDEVTDYLVASDGSLWYCRQAVNGVSLTGQIRRIVYTGPVSVSDDGVGGLDFLPPYPLPARDGAAFEYRLSDARAVELSLFDLVGRRVCVLDAGPRGPGAHRIRWNGRDEAGRPVASGLYFARLVAGRSERVRRIVVGR